MPDLSAPLTTSGARRGCGYRQPGGAYLALPLSPNGSPLEHFLIDPPLVVSDPATLGLTSVGTAMIERDGTTHVLDIVGREHYPTVTAFLDEARRMGVSRRISRNSQFSRLTPESRLLILHPHADIANALEFPTARTCPCHVEEHLDAGYGAMCARLWADEPLEGAQHRLAIFASFPIRQIEVVTDHHANTHYDTIRAAGRAGVPVLEVER